MKSVTKREYTLGLPLPVGHSMYHPMGPEADHRLAGSTSDLTNPSSRASLPSLDQAIPGLTGPRMPRASTLGSPNHTARRPHCLPGAAGPPGPLGRSPAPQPRSPAFLGPRWGACPPFQSCTSSFPAPTSCSLSAPPDASCLHPRPSGLGRSLGPKPPPGTAARPTWGPGDSAAAGTAGLL